MADAKEMDLEAGLRYELEHLKQRILSKQRMLDHYHLKIETILGNRSYLYQSLSTLLRLKFPIVLLDTKLQSKVDFHNEKFQVYSKCLNKVIAKYVELNSVYKLKSSEDSLI